MTTTSRYSCGQMIEVTGLHIKVVRFEVAVGRRLRVEPVVGQHDRLRVLELCEDLRLEDVVEDKRVRLRGADGGPMGGRTPVSRLT